MEDVENNSQQDSKKDSQKDTQKNLPPTPCNICLSTKNYLTKLSCHHSICNKCIHRHLFYNFNELTSGKSSTINLTCILCEKSHHTITKLEMLKFLNNHTSSNDQEDILYCTIEDHQGKKIEHYCHQCKCIMCADCLIKHNDFSLLKFHNITENLSQYALNLFTCAQHDYKKFKYQCLTCEIPICTVCSDLNHSGHKIKFISEYYNQVREEILLKKVPYENFSDFKEKLKKEQQEIFLKIKKESSKVYDSIQILIKKLENLKYEYKNKIDELENNQIISQEILNKIFEKLFEDFNQLKIQKSNEKFNMNGDFFKFEILRKMSDLQEPIVFDVDITETLPEYFIGIDNSLEKIKSQIKEIKEVYNKNKISKSELNFRKERGNVIDKNASNNVDKIANSNLKYKNLIQEQNLLEIENILDNSNFNFLTKHNIMSNSKFPPVNKKRNSHYDIEKKIKAHSSKINSIIFLKRKYVATCSEDGEIKIFNENFKLLRTIKAHEGEITNLLELQSENLISTGKDKFLKLWIRIENSRSNYFNLASFALPAPIIHLILINSENFAVAMSNGSINIIHFKNNMFYDLGTNLYWENNSISLKNFTSDKILYSNFICVTSQKYLVWGNSRGLIKVWYRDNLYSTDPSDYTNVYSNKFSTMLNDHTDKINKLIGIDSNRFVSCSGDCKIIVWLVQYKQMEKIMNPAQSQKIFNNNIKKELDAIAEHSFGIKEEGLQNPNTCPENFNKKNIPSQSQSPDITKMYLTTFSPIFLNGHMESVDNIEMMGNGKLFSLSSKEIRLWDLKNYTCIATVVDGYERCLVTKKIEEDLIIVVNNYGVRIYEAKKGLRIIKNIMFDDNNYVGDVKITMNRELLVGFENGEICKWSSEVFIPQK
jgi:hypothetical protein